MRVAKVGGIMWPFTREEADVSKLKVEHLRSYSFDGCVLYQFKDSDTWFIGKGADTVLIHPKDLRYLKAMLDKALEDTP